MKIGEALQEVKELSSKLSRLQTLQASLFSFVEGTQPSKTFEEYEKEINEIHDRIIDLKLKIQDANLRSKVTVTFDDNSSIECSIAKAILEVSKLRSKLYQLSLMVPQNPTYTYGKEQLVTYFQPITQLEKEEMITKLERMKRSYDLAIQGGNWTYSL